MKNCIVQYWIPASEYADPNYNNLLQEQPLHKISRKSFEQYSNKYDIDYIEINKKKINWKHPTFERFDLWLDDEWWEKYDQIMYVDSDVFALPWAPNIFDCYPKLDTFKYCHAPRIENAKSPKQQDVFYHGLLKETCTIEEVISKAFQTGVFILTKKSRDIMKPYIARFKEFKDHHDGEILNWANIRSGVLTEKMNDWFNFKNAHFRGKPKIYFFHAAGRKKGAEEHAHRIRLYLEKNGLL